MTDIYHFHPATGEYLGKSKARLDPIEKEPLVPANAKLVKPPTTGQNEIAISDGEGWMVVGDYRGWTGFDEAGIEQKIEQVGIDPDELWTIDKPFIFADAKLTAEKRIESARNEAIVQQVVSNALGADHIYSAKAENRQFLNDLITLGNGGKFTCIDVDGTKLRRMHTHAELLALAGEIETYISAQFDHFETKLTDIAVLPDTATQADFDAIVW